MDKMKSIQHNQPISDLEDIRLKQKCKDLKRKIQSIEKSNEIKSIILSRSKYLIKRLRFEYILLLEMLEKKTLLNSSILNSNQLTSLLDDSFEFNEENLDLNDLNLLLSNSPLVNLKSNDFTLNNLVNVVLQSKSKAVSSNAAAAVAQGNLANANGVNNGKDSMSSPDLLGNPYADLDESFINSTLTYVKRKRGGPGALKKARAKDPSIPKRPTNAYLIFCDLQKEKLKKEIEENKTTNTNNNNIDTETSLNTDLSKAMTEAWKKLNDEERKPYYELYEQDRLRYHREIEVYTQKLKKEKEQEESNSNADASNSAVTGTGTGSSTRDALETTENTPVPEDDNDDDDDDEDDGEDDEDDEDAKKVVKKMRLDDNATSSESVEVQADKETLKKEAEVDTNTAADDADADVSVVEPEPKDEPNPQSADNESAINTDDAVKQE